MLDNIRQEIDKSLATYLEKIRHGYRLDLVHPILYDSIKEFVLREGKRIRPLLFILSYRGYCRGNTPKPSSIYYASICMELLHNFMLIHDDIIDRSDLRRGKPTLHRLLGKAGKPGEKDKLGYDLSIVAGDIVYALAIDAFLSIQEDPVRKERALKYFIRTAVYTAMGEFIDTMHGVENVKKVKEEDVFLNYTLKTAHYTFDCPLVVGAILAGAKEKDIKLLAQLGLLIGQAFQIQDDIIGVFDSQKNIGKSILSDIAESKKTILVCHAYKTLPAGKRTAFMKYFTKSKKSYNDLVAIRRIFLDAGSLDHSLREISKRLDKARGIMGRLELKPQFRKLIEVSLLQLFRHSGQIAEKYRTANR